MGQVSSSTEECSKSFESGSIYYCGVDVQNHYESVFASNTFEGEDSIQTLVSNVWMFE